MAKKKTVKAEVNEYVSNPDPHALETVEVIKLSGYQKGDKLEGHPNTLNVLKLKGLVK